MAEINIKDHPELRHALAHMHYAIAALAKGNIAEAKYELDSIESLIFWESDQAMVEHLKSIGYGQTPTHEEPTHEELQSQELQKQSE